MFVNKMKAFFNGFGGDHGSEFRRILGTIGREVSRYAVPLKRDGGPKILYGPSFCIYSPCYAHDAVFSAALRARGAEIIPIYCDRVQHTECNYYGGVWGGGEKFSANCRRCCRTSENLWKEAGLMPLPFSRYLDGKEIRRIDDRVASLPDDGWRTFSWNGLAFGQWARDILVNNYVVGDYRLIREHERLGRAHLRNLLIVHAAYERILYDVRPDRVVTNDSYYGMWAIMQKLCERRGIPFYSHWSGTRPGAWCYARNDASMNLDYGRAWPSFSSIPLTDARRATVEEWLAGRLSGKDMLIDTASLATHCNEEANLSKIREGKPTALLAANVIWDLAALNKQVVFGDMIEWIAETIAWFGSHPEYQLIVKPHPGEQHPSIPETEERVGTALRQRGVAIPGNVAVLTPRSAITIYRLLPLASAGLVHTTTVGFEMSARGIPVITTARSPYRGFGFTLDPVTREDYFETIDRVLQGEKMPERERQVDLAYKFILFQHFHYYTKIGIMDYKWGETPRLNVGSLADILAGRNRHLDYIVDSVMAGFPIVSEDRWPAES
ncbi:MAG: capsule biosynthesis protein [Deltaproteobacteria bacterium]|nr:capsule biosynthesis protein [Deltaproteobacteria bacterium]